jgi:hypothetical protein
VRDALGDLPGLLAVAVIGLDLGLAVDALQFGAQVIAGPGDLADALDYATEPSERGVCSSTEKNAWSGT